MPTSLAVVLFLVLAALCLLSVPLFPAPLVLGALLLVGGVLASRTPGMRYIGTAVAALGGVTLVIGFVLFSFMASV